LGQTDDWMNEIYPMWVAARGILIVAPVNWYHAPAPLKAMIDRLVCADGGNPDPSSTHGKKAAEAKAIELNGGRTHGTLPVATSASLPTATSLARRRCGVRCRTRSPTCT
jgi:multimeric flavodoxin WrbA